MDSQPQREPTIAESHKNGTLGSIIGGRGDGEMASAGTAAGRPGSGTSTTRPYRMQSDIFGTGFGPNHDHEQHSEHKPGYGMTIPGENNNAFRYPNPSVEAMNMETMPPAGVPSGLSPRSARAQELGHLKYGLISGEVEADNTVATSGVDVASADQGKQDHPRNTREAGGNPLTGEGYTEDTMAHRKRQFQQSNQCSKLW